jgi:putative addiction module killer protein
MDRDVFDVRESDEVMAFLDGLKDTRTAGHLRNRIKRARRGNFGNAKSVGGGLYEMIHDSGPGYRLYYSQLAKDVFQVLCGGDKSTQVEDLKYARILKTMMEKEHERENPTAPGQIHTELPR